MAAAAPYVKLLRHLSSARDEYRSGVLDITWDGGSASVYMVFGQPNHATFESEDGRNLTGQEAITALVTSLPTKFRIEPWRKAVIRTETLRLTIDELLEPFAQLAGKVTEDRVDVGTLLSEESLPLLDFGLADFPLLPRGRVLWSDSAANVLELDSVMPQLPPSLISLTGPKLRAAAVVSRGQIIDAVWVDDEEQAVGEAAAIALMGTSEGVVSGFDLSDQRIAEALPMLWRFPKAHRDLSAEWINPQSFVEDILSGHGDCAVMINGPNPGVALFSNREFVGVYSQAEPEVSSSLDLLYELLQGDKSATVSIREMARDASAPQDRATVIELPVIPFSADVEAEPKAEPAAPWMQERQKLPTPPPWNPPPETESWMDSRPLSDKEEDESSEPEVAPAGEDVDIAASADEETITESDAGQNGYESNFADYGEIKPVPEFSFSTPEFTTADLQSAPPLTPTEPEPQFESAPSAPIDDVPTWFSSPAPLPQMAPLVSLTDTAASPSAAAAVTPRLELDFDEVRNELVQISLLWLGEDQNMPVQKIIEQAQPTVDDFVRAIEMIRNLPIEGVDQSVVRAMAREMHYHAAECLCGA